MTEINPDNIAQEEYGNWNDDKAVLKAADRAYFVDNSRDVVNSTDTVEPFTVFRTVDGRVVKTYTDEISFPDWTKAIYAALR